VIVLTATLRAQPGRRAELAALLDAIRVDTDDEPGTLTFLVHTARDDDRTVVCYEAYADDEAMVCHREGHALQELVAAFGDLVDGPPEIVYLEPYSTPSR
jgi:quinol monooxygenase YgiN